MAVTLRDIAKRVNLSHATVSFVLNDRRDVAIPETTRLRVMEAAKELGYQPNRAARALVMGRTRVIGVWTPPLTSPYLSRLFMGLTERFRRSNLDTLFCGQTAETQGNPFGWPVDGVVLVHADSLGTPRPAGVPVVEIGLRPDSEADLVRIDLVPGVTEAVRHLIESHRKHVLCVGNEADTGEGTMLAVFRKAIAVAGRTGERLALANGPTRQRVSDLSEFLNTRRQIDAILCGSDELAGIVRRALVDRGLNVPIDVALISCGCAEEHDMQAPSLSAIEPSIDLIADHAYEMLLARMADPGQPKRTETVETRLRIQESSQPNSRPTGQNGASAL